MNEIKVPLSIRFRNSFGGLKKTFSNIRYILLALVFSFFITGFLVWSLNLDLLRFTIIESGFALSDKLRILWDVQTGIYTAYSNMQATGIILFGLLFGINFALIVKAMRSNSLKKIPKKSGSVSLILAVISGGCVACGTSILAPLLATLGATASVTINELSNLLNWISIILITYSIYKLGGVINNTKA